MTETQDINSILAPTLEYRVIYVYSRETDSNVKGMLKIGDATLRLANKTAQNTDAINSDLQIDISKITQEDLKHSANLRINDQLRTSGATFKLEHVELAVKNDGESFRDYDVHNVLQRSNIKKGNPNSGAREWFKCTLEQAKQAIECVKSGKHYFTEQDYGEDQGIIFREEQLDFIKKANKWFKNGTFEKPKEYLGNLKMRFGKTLTSLQIAKENSDISKVLIATHRPVVNDGWFDDFHKVFKEDDGWKYGSRSKGETESVLNGDKFVYFVSIQDLRGSFGEDDNLIKNDSIFNAEWDLVVIDEAHEGTQTALADKVKANLTQKYILHLSGTPFNLVDQFDETNTSTWDYVNEQEAKKNWDRDNPETSNPYADLPQIKMFTYDLKAAINNLSIADQGKTFTLAEFFRVDLTAEQEKFTKDDKTYCYYPFVHKKEVMEFLNVISKTDIESPTYFPYANQSFAEFLKDTLWLLPGVEQCLAMEAMLQENTFFNKYTVVNASGDGTYEENNALEAVKQAIGENPEETYTITLSCGQLTTGVTIPAWTGVLMMNNMTSPSSYLQAAFRCQTPANIGGKVKTHCYVFDFDPDRCLSMAVAANQISKKPGEGNDQTKRAELKNFLDFLPIVNAAGAKLEPYDTDKLMQTLKRIYIEKTVQNGFDTPVLYDQFALRKLSADDIVAFNEMKAVVGSQQTPPAKKTVEVVNHNLKDIKLSSLELIKQGFEIIDKARYGEYKKTPSDKLLDETADKLQILKKVVDKIAKFETIYNLDNFEELDDKTQKNYLELQDEILVADSDARKLVQQVIKEANAKEKVPPTPEEIQAKLEREQAKNAEAILRAVAVRVPLLVFGANKTDTITIDNFSELIDDESWEEFMPKGFGKISEPALEDGNFTLTNQDGEKINVGWDYVKKFFAKDIFEGACKHIQEIVEAMDETPPIERVVHLANLFNTFKNPDKETVLTPFRIVNMQASSTIGGLRFVDDTNPHGKYYTNLFEDDESTKRLRLSWQEIQATNNAKVHPIWCGGLDGAKNEQEIWGKEDVTLLDMNSKTCLYPLYCAASLYAYRILKNKLAEGETMADWINIVGHDILEENQPQVWKEIIEQNIFVNCRVKYSKKIARRVLCGYQDDIKPNISVVDLIKLQKELKEGKPKITDEEMSEKFTEEMVKQFNFKPESI